MNQFLTSITNKVQSWGIFKGGTHSFYKDADGVAGGAPKLGKPYQNSAWVMSAIRHISNPIAGVPIIFSEDRRGGEAKLEDPILTSFWERPGMTRGGVLRRFDFIKATVSWLKLGGECFWVLDDSWLTNGTKNQILLARPDRMREVTNRHTGELLGWRFRDGSGAEQLLIPEQVKQIKNFNPYCDYRGLSEWEAAKIAADSDYAAGTFAKNLAESNGDRGPIVTADGNPSDEQIEQITRALREKSEMARRGLMKPLFIAGPNMKVQDPTVQAVDAAFVSQRLENRHEIYIAFGVPASFAEVAVSYSVGAASDYYRLIETACMPVAAQIADAIEDISQMLLGSQANIFAEFDFSTHSTMQQVRAERFEQATKGVDRGMPWKVASDYLGLKMPRFPGDAVGRIPFNVQEIKGGQGDQDEAELPALEDKEVKFDSLQEMKSLFACKAHAASVQKMETTAAEGAEAEPERVVDPARLALWEGHVKARIPWVKRYESRFNRLLMLARSETLANISKAPVTKGMITKNEGLDLSFDLGEWLKQFFFGMSEVHRNAMEQAGIEFLDEMDMDDPMTMPSGAVEAALARRENHLANTGTEIWSEVRQSIAEGIDAGENMDKVAGRVKATFNGISNKRARTIAMTETSAAYESGRFTMMREAGVEFKEWLTSQDDRVRISHWDTDGQRQKIDEPFVLTNGTRLMHPAETGGPPEEVINCRCVVIATDEA